MVDGGGTSTNFHLSTNRAFVMNSGEAIRKGLSARNETGLVVVRAGLGNPPTDVPNVAIFWGSSDDTASDNYDAFRMTRNAPNAATWSLAYGGSSTYLLDYLTSAHARAAKANGYGIGFPNGLTLGSIHNGGVRLLPAASAAPASGGPYMTGDTVYNTAPATGQPQGWVCTVAGSPGTWKPLANIA
jgi:hypothetical protein